jgi:hypothetical protein
MYIFLSFFQISEAYVQDVTMTYNVNTTMKRKWNLLMA